MPLMYHLRGTPLLQQEQWWLHDPCVPLTAASRLVDSRSCLRQGSSSPPLRMTSFKCFLPTQAFATPYSSVTFRGRVGISKGAWGGFKLRRDLGKPRAVPSSSGRCSETESWIKGTPWGEGEGWGHKGKSSPAESPLCLLPSCWDISEAGWRQAWRDPAATNPPLSLLHGKCSLDRGFGSGNGVEAPVLFPAPNTAELVVGHWVLQHMPSLGAPQCGVTGRTCP